MKLVARLHTAKHQAIEYLSPLKLISNTANGTAKRTTNMGFENEENGNKKDKALG